MSFISPEFVIFFGLVLPTYFLLAHRYRWVLLLLVSYFFYAYGNGQYVPLIAFSTIVDYIAARQIHRHEDESTRRAWLAASVAVNLGVLFIFKYVDFLLGSGSSVLAAFGVDTVAPQLGWVLPIGISFYTFQSMSYTIDVFRRKIDPEPNLGIMATYVAFFPQLVAGPIERAKNLLPQFHETHRFHVDRAVSGLQQVLWGFFKKVVIADRVAIYVNTVYNDLDGHQGWTLILATLFFGIQIYCDFSGYSDIAIGTARILGFDLMENFRQPYFAQSVRAFWGRWHISLSTWFRDYLYIPLGGNRGAVRRTVRNVLIVFTVSGLWHGAGWTFIVWGFLHGMAVAVQAVLRARGVESVGGNNMLAAWMRILLTFAFVNLTWIFFRANDLGDAIYVLTNLVALQPIDLATLAAPFAGGLLEPLNELRLSLALIGVLFAVDALNTRWTTEQMAAALPWPVRWTLYYVSAAAVILSGLYATGAQQFIYFQF